MPDLEDGESAEVQGSGSNRYTLKNVGGVYSCSCPAWRHQSAGIERRTCKHLRAYRGEEAERARLGDEALRPVVRSVRAASSGGGGGTTAATSTAPPVLLAERWDSQRPDGWWMSEKLDGVRAYWDGKQFISRMGNVYMAPDWFVERLPSTVLDGELWVGRKKFQSTVSIVRRTDRSDHWQKVKYLVFDAPDHKGPFEERLAEVERLLVDQPHALAHPHEVCRGIDHLRQELQRVEALGGEGLMLRKPGSPYIAGRSSTLLKVKTFHDAEALVVAHLPGAGRHKGRLGAVQAELPNGIRFSVGTGFSDAERESPPPVGSIITFRYQELSDGNVPRFPSYVGVRDDIAWPPDSPDQPGRKAPAAGAAAPRAAPKTPAPKAATPKAAAPKAAAPKAAAPNGGAPAGAGPLRHLEFGADVPEKFWEVEQKGCELYIRFGRVGSRGQTRLKTFGDDPSAANEAVKLAAEKLRKGYVERGR